MTKAEIANLPHNTQLFVVYRKSSRTNMQATYDVFYIVDRNQEEFARTLQAVSCDRKYNLRWIRIEDQESKEWRKASTGVTASFSADRDAKLGGAFLVKGYGFDRAGAVIEALQRFAGLPSQHFQRESF